MVSMNETPFTNEERRLIARAIARFGSGQHPYATAENIEYFARGYTAECLREAAVAMTPAGQALASAALRKIERV
jgi:hypothetical protein